MQPKGDPNGKVIMGFSCISKQEQWQETWAIKDQKVETLDTF